MVNIESMLSDAAFKKAKTFDVIKKAQYVRRPELSGITDVIAISARFNNIDSFTFNLNVNV